MLLSAFTVLIVAAIPVITSADIGFYTAAVYESAADFGVSPKDAVNRQAALEIMNSNLDVLEAQAIIAKSQVRKHYYSFYCQTTQVGVCMVAVQARSTSIHRHRCIVADHTGSCMSGSVMCNTRPHISNYSVL